MAAFVRSKIVLLSMASVFWPALARTLAKARRMGRTAFTGDPQIRRTEIGMISILEAFASFVRARRTLFKVSQLE